MNVQAHMGRLLPGQVRNQGTMSQQNGNSQMQNLVGTGLGQSSVSPLANDIVNPRQDMQIRIFNILQQKQPSPADDASKAKYMDVARRLEAGLYKMAKTKEEYMNQSTLEPRLASLIQSRPLNNYNQQHTNSSSAPVKE